MTESAEATTEAIFGHLEGERQWQRCEHALTGSKNATPQPLAAIMRPVVMPGDCGPVVVALVRRAGGPWQHIDREPGESLEAYKARAWTGA